MELRIELALMKNSLQHKAKDVAEAQAKAEAERLRVEAFSLYTSSIAHDLGTPLASIQHASEILSESELSSSQKQMVSPGLTD